MNPRTLKKKCDDVMARNTLMGSLASKLAPFTMLNTEKIKKEYFEYPKERAMLGLAYDVGCLNLRMNRKAESLKKFGSIQCLVAGCTGYDELRHIMNDCQGCQS